MDNNNEKPVEENGKEAGVVDADHAEILEQRRHTQPPMAKGMLLMRADSMRREAEGKMKEAHGLEMLARSMPDLMAAEANEALLRLLAVAT